MLTFQQLQQLKAAYGSSAPSELVRTRTELGAPSDTQIVQASANGMSNPDRNVRVLMLRILAHHQSDDAMHAILTGLDDPERRVRDVAVQSSVNLVHYPEIADKLGEMATDANEKRKIRERALSTLLGVGAPVRQGALPEPAIAVIEPLLSQADYRARILHGLVQIEPCKAVGNLLKYYIDEGAPEEAKMAQKALSGFQMVNIGHFEEGPGRETILRDCELASGRVFYWVSSAFFLQ